MSRVVSESLKTLQSNTGNYATRVINRPMPPSKHGNNARTWFDGFPVPKFTAEARYLKVVRADLTQPVRHLWSQMRQSRPIGDLVFKFADKRVLMRAPSKRIYGRINSMWRSSWGYMFSMDNLVLAGLWTPIIMLLFSGADLMLNKTGSNKNAMQRCQDLLADDAEHFVQNFHAILAKEPELAQLITHKYGNLSTEAVLAAWEKYVEIRVERGLGAVQQGHNAASKMGETPQDRLDVLRRALQRMRNLSLSEYEHEWVSDRDIITDYLNPKSAKAAEAKFHLPLKSISPGKWSYENKPIPMPPKQRSENQKLGLVESSYMRFPDVLPGSRFLWVMLEPFMAPVPPRLPLLDVLKQQGYVSMADVRYYEGDFRFLDRYDKNAIAARPSATFKGVM